MRHVAPDIKGSSCSDAVGTQNTEETLGTNRKDVKGDWLKLRSGERSDFYSLQWRSNQER